MLSSAWRGGDGAGAITAFCCLISSAEESASSRRDGSATAGGFSLSANTVAGAPASLSRALVAGRPAGGGVWAGDGAAGKDSERFNSATITGCADGFTEAMRDPRSEEHTSELQSPCNL